MESNTEKGSFIKNHKKRLTCLVAAIGICIGTVTYNSMTAHKTIPGYERRPIIGVGVNTYGQTSVPVVIIQGNDGRTHAITVEGAYVDSEVKDISKAVLYYKVSDGAGVQMYIKER